MGWQSTPPLVFWSATQACTALTPGLVATPIGPDWVPTVPMTTSGLAAPHPAVTELPAGVAAAEVDRAAAPAGEPGLAGAVRAGPPPGEAPPGTARAVVAAATRVPGDGAAALVGRLPASDATPGPLGAAVTGAGAALDPGSEDGAAGRASEPSRAAARAMSASDERFPQPAQDSSTAAMAATNCLLPVVPFMASPQWSRAVTSRSPRRGTGRRGRRRPTPTARRRRRCGPAAGRRRSRRVRGPW